MGIAIGSFIGFIASLTNLLTTIYIYHFLKMSKIEYLYDENHR